MPPTSEDLIRDAGYSDGFEGRKYGYSDGRACPCTWYWEGYHRGKDARAARTKL